MPLLFLGRSGQVATELQLRAPDARILGVDEADFSAPDAAVAAVTQALAETAPSAVINAAAYTAVDRAEQEEGTALSVNAITPAGIARACAEAGIPFVHISTDYVFDGSGSRAWRPDDPTGPLGAYGRTKLAGEEAIRAAGGPHAILRTSWVVSAHGANFVKTMLRLSETRDRLTIVADQIGGPTPAAAIADACLTIAARLTEDPGLGGTYHFSGAPDVSWADFAREIFRQSGREVDVADIPTEEYPTPAARPRNSRLDCARTRDVFGIDRPDWRDGVADILDALGATSQGGA